MSVFSLTKGSEAALSMLTRHAGTETLLLTQPARELRAEITIEPIGTADQRGQIEAVLFLREQRHTMTLQRGDGANAQHLADWVEAAANGTLDTAAAIPQRPSLSLLPCCKCGSEAISYDYAIPGSEFRYGVKCRHHGCQSVEGAETPAEAHAAWNAIQREELDEPAPAQDEGEMTADRAAYFMRRFKSEEKMLGPNEQAAIDYVLELLATRPARTKQPVAVPDEFLLMPAKLTAENGAKGALMGEFTIQHETTCSACFYDEADDDCEACEGMIRYVEHITVPWETIKEIYARAVTVVAAPAALTEKPSVAPTEGWQLVPVEPTPEMREAFHQATERYEEGFGESPDSQWQAMLRASQATRPAA